MDLDSQTDSGRNVSKQAAAACVETTFNTSITQKTLKHAHTAQNHQPHSVTEFRLAHIDTSPPAVETWCSPDAGSCLQGCGLVLSGITRREANTAAAMVESSISPAGKRKLLSSDVKLGV